MPTDVAVNYACSGPVGRASGMNYDVRKNAPYSIYDKFDFKAAVIEPGKEVCGVMGDCWNRNWVRILEIEESCKILEQAAQMLPMEGDVRAGIPKRIKISKGECYCKAESPKGELGFYVVSNGKDIPERCRPRSTSFVNLSVISEICKGYLFADVIMIVAGIDIVLGDVDR